MQEGLARRWRGLQEGGQGAGRGWQPWTWPARVFLWGGWGRGEVKMGRGPQRLRPSPHPHTPGCALMRMAQSTLYCQARPWRNEDKT